MVTKEQILAAEGDELSRLLSEVLLDGSGKVLAKYKTIACPLCTRNHCHKVKDIESWKATCAYVDCRAVFTITKSMCMKESKLIPLNWGNAMKWRDWAVGEYDICDFRDALLIVFAEERGYTSGEHSLSEFNHWLAAETLPEHYLKTAALCKIGDRDGQ